MRRRRAARQLVAHAPQVRDDATTSGTSTAASSSRSGADSSVRTAVFSHYLNDPGKNRIRLNGNTNVRLFKGFEFFVGGNYERIRDQIYLPKGEASDEEVLVRRRQLATGYRYFVEFGISYSFGSIFNNIVNPRMSGNSGVAIF